MTAVEIIPKVYDSIAWFSPKLANFPRKFKYTLGDRIFDCQLNILDCLIEAKYSKDKYRILRRANLLVEKLRFLIRLSKDLQCINLATFEHMIREMNEIGKMTGGWIKASRKNNG